MEEEPEYLFINPIWGGFKRPRFVTYWVPVYDPLRQSERWVTQISAIKTGYRNHDFPKDDVRHYNPLHLLDYDYDLKDNK
jgi:hypothetical protein|uniref:Uncharacterized protein n=1 Tax=viral metagenome TaxID=1070528 RepID=A0A6C0IQD8_9ZZZZ